MRGGCELHGREENRSEVHGEEQAPWALIQTPFLSFLQFLNNLTVHTNFHLVLSNLPHHENNTEILFVGQHKGQKQWPEQLADLAGTLHCCLTCQHILLFRRHLPFYRFKPSGFHLVLCGFCLLKTLLRCLLILGIHSWLRQGGNQTLLELEKALSVACWASIREMSSFGSFMLQNSFSFSDQPPDLEKVSRSEKGINSFFKCSCLFYLGELSVPACSSILSSSNWYWHSAPPNY